MHWEDQLERAWAQLDQSDPPEFLATIGKIVSDPQVPDDVRQFELACAYDSTGRPDEAVPRYREALQLGLSGYRGRRAVIQLASSLRNLGRPQESVALLEHQPTDVGDGLDDAVTLFLAFALTDLGREREALTRLAHVVADHLPRYTASAHRYADALSTSPDPTQAKDAKEV